MRLILALGETVAEFGHAARLVPRNTLWKEKGVAMRLIFAVIASLLIGHILVAVPRETSKTDRTTEAQRHYKVAMVALQRGDLAIAEAELKRACDLAPDNALVFYNLAVIESKRGQPKEALKNLKKAIDLGLPTTERSTAEDLLAELTYDSTKQEEITSELNFFLGRWTGDKEYTGPGRYAFHMDLTITNGRDAEYVVGEGRYTLDRSRGKLGWETFRDCDVKLVITFDERTRSFTPKVSSGYCRIGTKADSVEFARRLEIQPPDHFQLLTGSDWSSWTLHRVR